jgi:hypothetical protein
MRDLVLNAGPAQISRDGGPKRLGFGRFGRIARGLVAPRFATPWPIAYETEPAVQLLRALSPRRKA